MPANTNDLPDCQQDSTFQGLVRGNRSNTLKLRGVPKFTDPQAQRTWMKQHMAAAFRWFGKQGYGEGVSGHISMRGKSATVLLVDATNSANAISIDPISPDCFWINPFARHFSMMRASDLVLVDGEGYVVEGGNQACINEAGFMIHSEIHKARPDVVAACHTHSIYGKTWSAFGKPVEMLSQDACNFYGSQTVYEEHGGIALAQEEGAAIAKALGNNSVIILKNHGCVYFTFSQGDCVLSILIILIAQLSCKLDY